MPNVSSLRENGKNGAAAPKPVTLLTVAGTRPELLKLAPLIRRLRQPASSVRTKTCFSGQHGTMLQSVLGDLDVVPDIDFRMPPVQRSLSHSVAWLLERVDDAVFACKPDGVVVQGDTNTVLAGALVAHHHQLPCFHVEAGLRTSDPLRPFPEEMNRRLVSRLAALHFAPTVLARENLLLEGIDPDRIVLTGNTGIDALHIYAREQCSHAEEILARLRPNSRMLLVTMHRRENSEFVCNATAALTYILMREPDVEVVWILHLNGTRDRVRQELEGHPSVHLVEPQSYPTFVQLMKHAYAILTDSGGVQEEAPVFGKPVLVLRTETERPEAVLAGCARVIGCETADILSACRELLDNRETYAAMSQAQSPFGDGHASERIADALHEYYFPTEKKTLTLRPSPSVVPTHVADW